MATAKHFSVFVRHLSTAQPHTQKAERIADKLISLSPLKQYNYSILSRLKTVLNNYGLTIVASPSSLATESADELQQLGVTVVLE